jgi:O-antigen/teichoic acid export membrane protein
VSRLFRNVLYNLAGQGLVVLLGFVAVKFIYSRLGQDIFGIIYFNQVLALVLTGALELGISSTTIREVSGHRDAEPVYISRLIRTASLFYWSVGVVIFAAIYLSAPWLVAHWINLTVTNPETATTLIRILGVNAAVALPKVLYASLFRGLQRMEINNSIDVGASALQQLGIVVLLPLGVKVFGVASWIAMSALLGTLAYTILAGRLFGWRSLVPGYFKDVVVRNLRFTGHMMSISVLTLIQTQADKVIVSKLLPVVDLGIYGFASATVGRATLVATSISGAAFPSLSSLFKTGDRAELFSQYRKLHDLISFGCIPIFAAIIFAALPAYGYLFSPSVAQRLLLPTIFLCVGYVMNAVLTMPYTLTLAMGRPQIASRLNLLAIFVVLPVTVVLIYWLGLVGAGLSWVFYHLFAYSYMVPRVCRECLEVPVLGWYAHFLKVAGTGGILYALAWWLIAVPTSFSIPGLAIAYVIASLVFVVAAYFMIGPELKTTVHALPGKLTLNRAGSG